MADNCWCGISFCNIDDDEDEDDDEDRDDPLDELTGVWRVVVGDGVWIDGDGVACNDGNIEFVRVANKEVGAEIGANSFVLVKAVVRVDVDEDASLVGT